MGPPNRMEQARVAAGFLQKDVALEMGVDAVTVSNWERGRRPLTMEKLLQYAKVCKTTVSFLLGAEEQPLNTEPVDRSMLHLLNWTPVWVRGLGWALVNADEETLVFPDKSSVPFDIVQVHVYMIPPAFALGLRGIGDPMGVDDVMAAERVWVEPIATDAGLAAELRGWYKVRRQRHLIENEFGNRFYFDTYGAKWLAFESILPERNSAE